MLRLVMRGAEVERSRWSVSALQGWVRPHQIAAAEAEAAAFEVAQAELAKTEYQRTRAAEYPAVGEQLDAIWKELNQRRLNGEELVQDADDMLGKILNVKKENPKPEELS